MAKEKINRLILDDFLKELPESLPGSRVAVLNIARETELKELISPGQLEKCGFISMEGKNVDDIVEDLIKETASKKFIFVNFVGYLSPGVFNLLEMISKEGWFEINNSEDGEPTRTVIPADAHIILVSERKFVESQFGNLNNLTTYILDMENN